MSSQKPASHKDLLVWQKSVELTVSLYRFTENFPKNEVYGLVSQMRRATVSIASNIAEGKRRGTRKDFRQFVYIAFGSGAELETQLEISERLGLGDKDMIRALKISLDEVMRMLNALIRKLSEE